MAGLCLSSQLWAAPDESAVLKHYADLAHVMYQDSLTIAQTLDKAIDTLIAQPTEAHLQTAKDAWIAARIPYQQTEAYRFGNAIVDEWEGKVNAWPLDEGLIDYVSATYYGHESDENPHYTANVIANEKLMLSGKIIDTRKITKKLLAETLHEVDEIEANVATGYHAIEFLLWGQDLNGNGPGAGNRSASDYDTQNCKVGHCDRRDLALVKIRLGALREQLAERGEATSELLEEIAGLITTTVREARSLMVELSPPVLHELGLEAAIEWLVECMEKE